MLSHFLDSFGSVLGYGTAMLLIFWCFIYLFTARYSLSDNPGGSNKKHRVNRHFSREKFLEEILAVFEKSKIKAKDFADKHLEEWIQSLQPNIEVFMEEYFDYFYQKKIGLMSLISKESLQTEVAQKIEVYILSPTQMERKMQNILTQTVDVYAVELAKGFMEIQCKYELSNVEFQELSMELSKITYEKGGIIYQFSNIAYWIEKGGKDMAITGAVYGMKMTLSSTEFIAYVGKQATKILAKLGCKTALKAGLGKAITSFAAKCAAGWIAGFLIIGSDIWSHHSYVSKQKPYLRKALLEQVREIKNALLEGHEYSIMSAITQIEYQMTQVSKSSSSTVLE
ncbi:hypothetical protein VF14_14255 [Nostoc linckia z18]|uniref:Uncharacterized protein n=2 Tax=Nostoc linckia TaxID=92942 RepID=A0A9Q6ELE5_NOSLI|nr:hypothetical protein [Nostoc linckia]PHK40585.1 hypothetical protein VF12_10025 [Nostoc linckia z15]PHK46747.1 hypothetical protein VF13_09360 [Nostoc linckia z16]PHJ60715.1 hypothetical protein VF02_21920 [Nostoc linckia z1]PHJ62226.1 hypothetical protein VF05_27255 [Nostoc linckia z3]PHJ71476.1 hypothetical protein VF03_20345 [Nostoc linckia z2]